MIRALFDLVRALFIRPDQLSVPMTERRPAGRPMGHQRRAVHPPDPVQTRLIEIAERIKHGYPDDASYLRRLATGWGVDS